MPGVVDCLTEGWEEELLNMHYNVVFLSQKANVVILHLLGMFYIMYRSTSELCLGRGAWDILIFSSPLCIKFSGHGLHIHIIIIKKVWHFLWVIFHCIVTIFNFVGRGGPAWYPQVPSPMKTSDFMYLFLRLAGSTDSVIKKVSSIQGTFQVVCIAVCATHADNVSHLVMHEARTY